MGVAQFFLRYGGPWPYDQAARGGDLADLLGGDAGVPGLFDQGLSPSSAGQVTI